MWEPDLDKAMSIITVNGSIPASEVGCTMSHEHVLCDLWAFIKSYDGILDDESLAITELARYRDAGGTSLVDATSNGLGRNPLALRRISKASRCPNHHGFGLVS